MRRRLYNLTDVTKIWKLKQKKKKQPKPSSIDTPIGVR